jgi:DMATS type aromatic prenyltransferase
MAKDTDMNVLDNARPTTYSAMARTRLTGILRAVGDGDRAGEAGDLLDALTDPWGHLPIPARPEYFSLASNDGAPIELSMGWQQGKPTEVRATWEAQGNAPTPAARQAAARDLTYSLARYPGVCLKSYEKLEDLFLPDNPLPFTAGHSVVWSAGHEPCFKLYFNAQAQGQDNATDLVTEALGRLGLAQAWQRVLDHYRGRSLNEPAQELIYVALDLSAHDEARVKIYIRHAGATAADLEDAACVARQHQAGEALQACRNISTVFEPKPPVTTLTIRKAWDRPDDCTLYFPISPNLRDDAAGLKAIESAFNLTPLSPEPCRRALASLGDQPAHHRMLNYVGITGRRRVTVYLSLEAHPVPTTWSRSDY